MATAASRHVVAVVRIKLICYYVCVGSWRRRALDTGCLWLPGPPSSAARIRGGREGVSDSIGVGAAGMNVLAVEVVVVVVVVVIVVVVGRCAYMVIAVVACGAVASDDGWKQWL